MGKRPVNKRAMIFNQEEVITLKNLIESGKIIVHGHLDGSLDAAKIKDLETTLNAFGKALIWDNEKILDPKVKY